MPINFKHWRRAVLLFMTAVIALLIVGAVGYHYHLKSAVDQYRAELKAKGTLKDVSELRPPSVPLEEDGTGRFLRAASQINQSRWEKISPPAMQMVAPGKAMVGADQSSIWNEYVTNSWEEAQAAFDPNKTACELLTQMIERPKVDFRLPYENGVVGLNLADAHLSEFKKSVQLLAGSAVLDLHQGNASAAVTNCRAALSLTAAIGDQRLLITELVRIATTAISQTATWEILQSGKASDAELAALQNDWERLEFIRSYRHALEMECACTMITLEQWRDSGSEIYKVVGQSGSGDAWAWVKNARLFGQISLWRYWTSYPDELYGLKGSEILRKAELYAETNGAFGLAFDQQEAQLNGLAMTISDEQESHSSPIGSMLDRSSSLSRSFKKVMLAEAIKRMTVTAIALKRYQLAHGKYPETLAQLSPDLLKSIPRDPVDGKPLRYKLNADGTFLLYSVGEDGRDDGGDPQLPKTVSTFSWQRGRDWVWPQPATPQEIQAWQSSKGKRR